MAKEVIGRTGAGGHGRGKEAGSNSPKFADVIHIGEIVSWLSDKNAIIMSSYSFPRRWWYVFKSPGKSHQGA